MSVDDFRVMRWGIHVGMGPRSSGVLVGFDDMPTRASSRGLYCPKQRMNNNVKLRENRESFCLGGQEGFCSP